MPRGSFVDLGGGISASSPELIFVEMAKSLPLPELALLGCELCGRYVLDHQRPGEGGATHGVPAATSVENIRSFARRATWIPGARRALLALRFVVDNAWSAMEALIAVVAGMPVERHGYGMRGVTLNVRIRAAAGERRRGRRSSRVPDLLMGDTKVGINYDGSGHLDLDRVVRAARAAERGPGDVQAHLELAGVLHEVREKYVDDRRRDRELGANGYLVLVATKEDLYAHEGLDALMWQVIEGIERRTGAVLAEQRRALEDPQHVQARQRLVWSLLPAGDASLS